MTDWRKNTMRLAVAGLLCGVSTAAFGLPWDIDMADSQAVKGYEHPQTAQPLPEGVVAQPHVLSPRGYAPNYDRATPEGQALVSPLKPTDDVIAQGEKMYGIYCTPCHGVGANLGPAGQPGRVPGVVALTGDTGIAKQRTDGWIYLTVRNGGAIMGPYNWAMDDEEMWSIVHYIRTLPGGAYIPPAPAEEEAEQ